ncbi:MAG: mannose-1-phosphate guanylyltransferase [Bryobacteraceae bacterium]|nr:mannose-1-phosphate guanylyltransferase [Bryobacteraceae bacterium]
MAKQNRHALILAGGSGTRFWPRSRRSRPKQLLPFFGDRSLLQETLERLRPEIPPERTWILTSDALREEIRTQLPEVPELQVLAEPEQRNTAPCLGLAAQIVQRQDPDAVLGVFPSDHLIGRPARFRRLLRAAFRAAESGGLVVLGIEPRWPETGYGYIEFPDKPRTESFEPARVKRFREKPDLKTARRFVAAGRFYWNSGMFFWRAGVFVSALRRHLPRTAALLAALPEFSDPGFNARLKEVYRRAENISVDYAVLEKADNVIGLAAGDIGWNDLGSWNALCELLPADRDGNVLRTDSVALSSAGNYVDAPGKLVALVGVDNLVIVDTPDALLIAGRASAQQVGQAPKLLEKRGRTALI